MKLKEYNLAIANPTADEPAFLLIENDNTIVIGRMTRTTRSEDLENAIEAFKTIQAELESARFLRGEATKLLIMQWSFSDLRQVSEHLSYEYRHAKTIKDKQKYSDAIEALSNLIDAKYNFATNLLCNLPPL